MAASSGAAAARKSRVTPKTVFACAIGNVLEWYDFTAYGFLATIIGASFFPSGDSFASVLAAFGALAAGYGARPLGSIIGGHLGDRIGRKPTMILCMATMGVSTCLLGLLPTYEQIGVTAAVLLVAIRLVQGLSVAGEYSSSSVLLVENAEPRRRGFVGTWIACAMMAGCLLGSGMAALSSAVVGDEAMKEWGWRIPFLFGGVIAIIGIIIRRRLTESAAMPGEDEILAVPIVSAFRDHWRTIVTIIGINMPISVSYFVIFVYAVSYLTDQMHFTTAQAMDINTASLIAMTVLIPFTGLAADRFGRKAVLYASLLGTIVAGWPAWYLMHTPELGLGPGRPIDHRLSQRGGLGVIGAADGRAAARQGALHRRWPWLQHLPRPVRRHDAADRCLSGRTHGRRLHADLPRHGCRRDRPLLHLAYAGNGGQGTAGRLTCPCVPGSAWHRPARRWWSCYGQAVCDAYIGAKGGRHERNLVHDRPPDAVDRHSCCITGIGQLGHPG